MTDEKLVAMWPRLPDTDHIATFAALEFSQLAQKWFEAAGRGYVVGPLVTGIGQIQAAYVRECDIDTATAAPRTMNETLRETVATYDPKKEFVMLVVSKTGCVLISVGLIAVT